VHLTMPCFRIFREELCGQKRRCNVAEDSRAEGDWSGRPRRCWRQPMFWTRYDNAVAPPVLFREDDNDPRHVIDVLLIVARCHVKQLSPCLLAPCPWLLPLSLVPLMFHDLTPKYVAQGAPPPPCLSIATFSTMLPPILGGGCTSQRGDQSSRTAYFWGIWQAL